MHLRQGAAMLAPAAAVIESSRSSEFSQGRRLTALLLLHGVLSGVQEAPCAQAEAEAAAYGRQLQLLWLQQ